MVYNTGIQRASDSTTTVFTNREGGENIQVAAEKRMIIKTIINSNTVYNKAYYFLNVTSSR